MTLQTIKTFLAGFKLPVLTNKTWAIISGSLLFLSLLLLVWALILTHKINQAKPPEVRIITDTAQIQALKSLQDDLLNSNRQLAIQNTTYENQITTLNTQLSVAQKNAYTITKNYNTLYGQIINTDSASQSAITKQLLTSNDSLWNTISSHQN